jgi:hypothetical protein
MHNRVLKMPIAVLCDVLMRMTLGQRTCFSPTTTQNCQQILQTSAGMMKIADKIIGGWAGE